MRGMTWDHPRGFDPLVAASDQWERMTGQAIQWDRRSLQDFETYPVEDLARNYDLIVIDHPHVGQIADTGALVALDSLIDADALGEIAAGSVGGSFESYQWKGHQWALPIDAAAQVQAWMPGRIAGPLARWEEVMALAENGRVAVPLRPPHSLMSLFTLCGMTGVSLDPDDVDLFPPDAALAYQLLERLAARLDPIAYGSDPIAMLEDMARPDSVLAVAPLIYGYVSYAQDGFRTNTIRFADLPALEDGPCGSALGGTGIAVSAFGRQPEEAARFAAWIASGAVQRDLVASEGGQPAHAIAWDADATNATTHDFYRATRATLDRAWLRPRHRGYMDFQHQASERLNAALQAREPAASALAALNALYRASH
ncbi:extracellular solute-binding protein [Sphingomonas aliaeris]|uniref:Extracellular solute-binding protein n=1 Tax=Sphingomonas aliaeris TaxID=2759526 RepID=A0A974NUV6_9SPHN|nr:extracellular solute-binding protein [Sphingomonas aliaeris]QQV77345.1 extracellular solute-binding protein [Sphingomonas aliaeris]